MPREKKKKKDKNEKPYPWTTELSSLIHFLCKGTNCTYLDQRGDGLWSIDRKPHLVKYLLNDLLGATWNEPCIDHYLSTRHFPAKQENPDAKIPKKSRNTCIYLACSSADNINDIDASQPHWTCTICILCNARHWRKSCECISLHQ